MTQVKRPGFVDKNGNRVLFDPPQKIDKPDAIVTEDMLAAFGPNNTLKPARWSDTGLNNMLHYLENSGVIFGGKNGSLALTVSLDVQGNIVIDTQISGEILSRLDSKEVKSGVFTPIRVLFDADDSLHIGYYWTDGTDKSIHVEGLVFHYDSTNQSWLPAHACLISNQVPHWEKIGETTGLLSTGTPSVFSIDEVTYSRLYVGMPVRLFGISSSAVGLKCRVLQCGYSDQRHSYFVTLSITTTAEAGLYEIHALSNLDDILHLDTVPTQGSYALMTSGAIYTALKALEARITALEALHENPAEETPLN